MAIEINQATTQEEVEALKRNWTTDPCWDIENTEGFEKYHDELLAFRMTKEKKWKEKDENDEIFERLRKILNRGALKIKNYKPENERNMVMITIWKCIDNKVEMLTAISEFAEGNPCFKFRAECQLDIDRFFKLLPIGLLIDFCITSFSDFPQSSDRECTIWVKGLEKKDLKRYMSRVEDGHVMVETINYREKYTGERTYKE